MVPVRLRLCFNLPSRLLASPRSPSASRASGVISDTFQSAKQITGFPKVTTSEYIATMLMFQSAKQITGFPKFTGVPTLSPSPHRFQSAKQITGFPKLRTLSMA